jgi:saccharopine dehydrogenase-like NADP-dependent oxidoreductase
MIQATIHSSRKRRGVDAVIQAGYDHGLVDVVVDKIHQHLRSDAWPVVSTLLPVSVSQ